MDEFPEDEFVPKENCPPHGTFHYKNYADCQPYHSITCCRPDCRRCFRHSVNGTKWAIEELLAVIKHLQQVILMHYVSYHVR